MDLFFLKERMDKLGIECQVRLREEYGGDRTPQLARQRDLSTSTPRTPFRASFGSTAMLRNAWILQFHSGNFDARHHPQDPKEVRTRRV
jgi:hypothetical protein